MKTLIRSSLASVALLALTSTAGAAGTLKMMPLTEFVHTNAILELKKNDRIMVMGDAADAENLALLAERLFYTTGVVHVREVAQEALRLNPNNKKAQLYNALGEIMENSRGLFNRVTPLARKMGPGALAGLATVRDALPFETRQFFLDGPQDIDSALLLQEYFLNTRASIQRLSGLLDTLKDEPLFINAYVLELSAYYWDYWGGGWVRHVSSLAGSSWRYCPASRVSKGVYIFEACNYPLINYPGYAREEVKLARRAFMADALDIEGIKTGVNALNIYFSLMTSAYSFEGLEKIAGKLLVKNTVLTPKKIIDTVRTEPAFLTLKDRGALADIKLKGLEFLDALDWFQKNMNSLCGSETGDARVGHLVGPAICMTGDINKALLLGHQALNGPIEVTQQRLYWDDEYRTEVDLTKLFDGSIADLKTILPASFDTCGNATSLADNSLGGIFPHNDFTEYRRFRDPDFLRPVCYQRGNAQ